MVFDVFKPAETGGCMLNGSALSGRRAGYQYQQRAAQVAGAVVHAFWRLIWLKILAACRSAMAHCSL